MKDNDLLFIRSMSSMHDAYENSKKRLKESIVTDIVEMDSSEMVDFATYWLDGAGEIGADPKMLQYVPGDIILEHTVPITDLKIRSNSTECRVTIFQDEMGDLEKILEKCEFSKGHRECPLIGCVTLSIGNDVNKKTEYIPLVYDMSMQAIMPLTAIARQTKGMELTVPRTLSGAPDMDIFTLTVSTMLNAWYGIEIALLHPVTEEIFAHPARELRNRKEQLVPVIVDGKPKRVKYVKKHIIRGGENGIYDTLERAAQKLTEERKVLCTEEGEDESSPKRKFTRRKLLWRVIGHTRTLSDGRETWIAPYWKGVLRDMPGVASFTANDRLVDKPQTK